MERSAPGPDTRCFSSLVHVRSAHASLRNVAAPVVFWFRRDLRVEANQALAEAASRGPVLPVFVVDDVLWNASGANRTWFLAGSLDDLDRQVGGTLVIRRGDPATVLHELADAAGATDVYATDDYGPYGRARDTRVGETLATKGISTHYRSSNYVLPPGTLVSKSDTPYKVFTPFYKLWITAIPDHPDPTPEIQWVNGIDSDDVPDAPAPTATNLPVPGEEAAWHRFERFQSSIVARYDDLRDLPGIDGTSRLSPYLKWGTVHPIQLIERLGTSPGEEAWIRQLCWRDFYAEILFHRPDSARAAYVPGNSVDADTDEAAEERFERWCAGETGYPIVDAGMRQLSTEGWMHNRVRMITASFLVKDLHLPWQWGARYFMQHLVDGDLASNNHGWQWVAGTGTDASPYYRVFNPTTQSAKFDKDGAYIRHWIPELAHLGNKVIHDPASDPFGAPPAYPPPMVDHAAERIEALVRYERRREAAGTSRKGKRKKLHGDVQLPFG